MKDQEKDISIPPFLKRDDVKAGLIAGGITVVVYLIAYFINPLLYFGSGIYMLTFLVYLVVMWQISKMKTNEYLTGLDREAVPAYSFSDAIQPPFVVFLVAQTLYYFQYYLMFTVIDPSMTEVAEQYAFEALERTTGILVNFADESTIDEIVMNFEDHDFSVTFLNTLMSWARSLIGGFILAAIFALIYKRTS